MIFTAENILLIGSILLFVSIVVGKTGYRFGVPALLLFLLVGMLFGSDVKKQFFQKRIKGRGYCDVGTSVISEFYTPLVPKGHDFLQAIGSLALARQAVSDERKEN